MDWFGSFWILHGLVVGTVLAAYYLGRRRYEPDRGGNNRKRGWKFASIPATLAAIFAAALAFVLNADYRATPDKFFWLWGGILISLNVAAVVRMLWPRWGLISGRLLRDFYNLGGVWGNWASGENNQHRPPTTHNFWGTAAACWAVLVVLSSWLYVPGSNHFDTADVSYAAKTTWRKISDIADSETVRETAKAVKTKAGELAAEGSERYQGTPLGKFLTYVTEATATPATATPSAAPTPATALTAPPPVFPRSTFWWWVMTPTVVVWAFFANIICRRDGMATFFGWLANLFRRKPEPKMVVTSETAPAATKAEGGGEKDKDKEKKGEGGGKHPTFSERLTEEVAAEAIIRGGERAVVRLFDSFSRWLRRKA